jgi:hypothetical protein
MIWHDTNREASCKGGLARACVSQQQELEEIVAADAHKPVENGIITYY